MASRCRRAGRSFAAAARTIQEGERAAGNAGFWGFLWQGRVGEGLTANALEWITSAGSPGILGQDGSVLVDDPRSAIALGRAASWVGTISPGGVLDMGGGDSLAAFTAGNAAFLRYWSNGVSLVDGADSKVGGKTGMIELPAATDPMGGTSHCWVAPGLPCRSIQGSRNWPRIWCAG